MSFPLASDIHVLVPHSPCYILLIKLSHSSSSSLFFLHMKAALNFVSQSVSSTKYSCNIINSFFFLLLSCSIRQYNHHHRLAAQTNKRIFCTNGFFFFFFFFLMMYLKKYILSGTLQIFFCHPTSWYTPFLLLWWSYCPTRMYLLLVREHVNSWPTPFWNFVCWRVCYDID